MYVTTTLLEYKRIVETALYDSEAKERRKGRWWLTYWMSDNLTRWVKKRMPKKKKKRWKRRTSPTRTTSAVVARTNSMKRIVREGFLTCERKVIRKLNLAGLWNSVSALYQYNRNSFLPILDMKAAPEPLEKDVIMTRHAEHTHTFYAIRLWAFYYPFTSWYIFFLYFFFFTCKVLTIF